MSELINANQKFSIKKIDKETIVINIYDNDILASIIGEFNEKGHREGLWTYFYEDGSIKDKVEYKDGEKLTNPK